MAHTATAAQPDMPELLADLLELEFDYDDGDGIDFEPYSEFLPAADTCHWLKRWTGNDAADGSKYLVFGQDGTGGLAAIWLASNANSLLEQPIVFFGSEGELGVVANSFYDFLWLLAGGMGPYEACSRPEEREDAPEFEEFAAEHAPAHRKSALAVVREAEARYPDFVRDVRALTS